MPQGSPVSGDALNLFFWKIDQGISSRAGTHSIKPSRIADDFVFSGKRVESGETLASYIESELAKLGININQRKKERGGFQDKSTDRRVHGICTSKRAGTSINREQSQFASELAESYLVSCKSVTADSFEAVAQKRRTLVGWMHYCRQAHYSPAKHIRRLLEAGDRKISKKLRSLSITPYKNKWWIANRKRNEPRCIAKVWKGRILARAAASPATATIPMTTNT
jgi:hypothetical protein